MKWYAIIPPDGVPVYYLSISTNVEVIFRYVVSGRLSYRYNAMHHANDWSSIELTDEFQATFNSSFVDANRLRLQPFHDRECARLQQFSCRHPKKRGLYKLSLSNRFAD